MLCCVMVPCHEINAWHVAIDVHIAKGRQTLIFGNNVTVIGQRVDIISIQPWEVA